MARRLSGRSESIWPHDPIAESSSIDLASSILSCSYAALGLLSDLKLRPSGGLAPGTEGGASLTPAASSSATASGSSSSAKPARGMGRIIRDADGNVLDIIEGSAEPEDTPWGKPLKNWEDAEDEAEDEEEETEGRANVTAAQEESEVVKGMYLRCRAVVPGVDLSSRPRLSGVPSFTLAALQAVPDPGPLLRHVSELEAHWLLSLVRKHGEDVDAMAMDKKLNENQKTKGEIRSR